MDMLLKSTSLKKIKDFYTNLNDSDVAVETKDKNINHLKRALTECIERNDKFDEHLISEMRPKTFEGAFKALAGTALAALKKVKVTK